MQQLRCSSLPVIERCAAAAQAPAIHLDTAGDPATLGTAVHEYAAAYAAGLRPVVAEIARRKGVNERELGFLTLAFRDLWNEVKDQLPNVQTERSLVYERDADVILTGTTDALSFAEDARQIRLCDWKSGRLDTDHDAQLKGYALLALELYSEAETAWIGTFRLRDRVIDGNTFTREEIGAWWVEFKAHLQRGAYTPGDHCGRCPRSHECPAKSGLMRQAVEAMGVADRFMASLPTVPAERATVLIPAVQQARMLKAAMESFIDLARADVEAHGGQLSDGANMLAITEENRKEVLPVRGWDVMREFLSQDEIVGCVSIANGLLESAVKKDAPRGQKGLKVKELYARLEAEGALEKRTIRKLEVKQVKEIANVADANPAPAPPSSDPTGEVAIVG